MSFSSLQKYYLTFFIILSSLSIIFLLILIRPLFKFSKERTALYIMLSKSIGNIIYRFNVIFNYSNNLFPYFNSAAPFIYKFVIMPISFLVIASQYIHIIALALNRFHAVYFPFSYQEIWKLRNIKYIIFFIWLIIFSWAATQQTVFILGIDQTGFF
ncbi:hypothetical protein Mgra_00003891, partial [Meloidogyne graminicola]